MAKIIKKELEKLIGKLPEKWDKMTLEEKIWQVDHKWRLISKDDMYDLHVSFTGGGFDDLTIGARFSIEPDGEHQFTEDGSCFAIPKPSEDGQVDKSKFPEHLRGFIDECALCDWETDESYTCALHSEVEADTFEECAKKMWFFLDLLTCGYEMTEIEWYKEKHPDLFPEEDRDEGDDDWEEEDELDEDANL